MTEAVFYVDTNAFLQLRDLADLPWRDLAPGAHRFRLMVARAVIDELDTHKTGANRRRRDRARAALRLIDAASENPDRSIVLRREPIEVVVAIAPRHRVDWETIGLDPTEPDDRIVAAALMDRGSAVLSHDTGPRISARDVGVTAYAPPPDWLLPPERTEDQRRLGEAERRIAELTARRPDVTIAFDHECGTGGVYVARRYVVPPLPQTVVAHLAALHVAVNPISDVQAADDRYSGLLSVYHGGVNSFDIAQYRDDYAAFVTETGKWFADLHRLLSSRTFIRPVPFRIMNAGQASAARLVVRVEVAGATLLGGHSDADDLFGGFKPPKPPEAPEARSMLSPFAHQHFNMKPSGPEDPTELQWIRRPRYGATSATYGCEDFRPERSYEDEALLVPSSGDPSNCSVTVLVSADHMPERSVTAEVRFETVEASWNDQAVLDALPDGLARTLSSQLASAR